MEGRNVLDLIRPLVAEISGDGIIARAEGGNGGFLGHDPVDLEGTSVFDRVEPAEATRLAEFFIEQSGGGMETVSLPLPFRIEFLDVHGYPQPVDIIPTAYEEGGVLPGWVVVAIPVSLTTAISAPLEAEMAGASRSEVRRLLAEELGSYESRWMFVDLAPSDDFERVVHITVADPIDQSFADAAEAAIADGWHPWADTGNSSAVLLKNGDIPTAIRGELHALGHGVIIAAPVTVQGSVVAAFLNVSERGAAFDRGAITANVMDRIINLVNVTSLVLERWRDGDGLRRLARTDTLTGLANRQAFSEALHPDRAGSMIVYLDVDGFKRINDSYGHDTGDRVLQEVAQRITASCRPKDVVARIGGDEFAVLLDGVDADTAACIGHRIVESVRAPMPVPDGVPITVSAGLAQFNGSRESVNIADQAMLIAKRSGRDRLVVA